MTCIYVCIYITENEHACICVYYMHIYTYIYIHAHISIYIYMVKFMFICGYITIIVDSGRLVYIVLNLYAYFV